MEKEFDLEKEKVNIEKDGKMVECDILFTFDCEDTMKSYIGYTDHSIAANGRKNIYVSSYNPLSPKPVLENITEERDLEMINDVLEEIDSQNQ